LFDVIAALRHNWNMMKLSWQWAQCYHTEEIWWNLVRSDCSIAMQKKYDGTLSAVIAALPLSRNIFFLLKWVQVDLIELLGSWVIFVSWKTVIFFEMSFHSMYVLPTTLPQHV
jgi:hypothetical protein